MCLLVASGKSFRDVAKIIGRDHSIWSREYKRNTLKRGIYKGEYIPCKAHDKATIRGAKQRYKAPLKCPEIFLYVRKHLELYWSPEEISGRLRLEHPGLKINPESIYTYIYKPQIKKLYHFEKFLTLARKKRQRKTGRSVQRYANAGIPALHIEERPKEIQNRHEVGHWETDNMEGKRSDKLCVSATVERKIRYTSLGFLANKTAAEKSDSIVTGLSSLPELLLKTMTFDNGKENSYCQLTKTILGTEVYKTTPYHSWEKGTVENTIGRLRRFLPKGQTLTGLTPEYLQQIQDMMNDTPRKCLEYQTPNEMMRKEIKKAVRLQAKVEREKQLVEGGSATLNRQ
jgi:IS30 family transposase